MPVIHIQNDEDFLNQLGHNGLVVVDFTASWFVYFSKIIVFLTILFLGVVHVNRLLRYLNVCHINIHLVG